MALTINPAVSRTRTRFTAYAAAFFAGSLMGALATSAAVLLCVALLDAILPWTVVRTMLLVAISLAILHDLGVPVRLPYRQQQVPEWLRDAMPQSAVALVYGSMLGAGFLTLFTYSAQVAMLAALPTLPSFSVLLLVVSVFAFGKTIVLASTFGVDSVDQISQRFTVDRGMMRLLRFTTGATSAMLGIFLVMHT